MTPRELAQRTILRMLKKDMIDGSAEMNYYQLAKIVLIYDEALTEALSMDNEDDYSAGAYIVNAQEALEAGAAIARGEK